MIIHNKTVFVYLTLLLAAIINIANSKYTLEYGKLATINFPRQLVSSENPSRFVRIETFDEDGNDEGLKLNRRTQRRNEFSCPESYIFDAAQMKCKRDSHSHVGRAKNVETCDCDSNYAGDLTYSMDCRKFINCWYGRGYVMPCAEYLLFDNSTKQCNYPKLAGCCEYWEKSRE